MAIATSIHTACGSPRHAPASSEAAGAGAALRRLTVAARPHPFNVNGVPAR
ncbi:MAG: hypothetical protein AcusKO_18860 [Acuticoccus sp.]